MKVVTGGAGFIGSNIVRGLNQRGHTDILVVDDLTDGKKFKNLVGCDFVDYMDKEDFIQRIRQNESFPESISVIFHEGACSATTEWNGKFMMEVNYQYSKDLLHYCLNNQIQFIYASSAATYGNNTTFIEDEQYEAPINVYGYSKYLFDQYVRRQLKTARSQIVGMRYFNVYGPHEEHKGSMASVAFHHYQQLHDTNKVKLFKGSDGYGDGEQRRDFIYVSDVVDVNLWMYDHPEVSGIFNVGSGRSQPFNDVANAVIHFFNKGKIEYIPFPEHLKGHYQSFTEANIDSLRAVGYKQAFKTVEQGVKEYLQYLTALSAH